MDDNALENNALEDIFLLMSDNALNENKLQNI